MTRYADIVNVLSEADQIGSSSLSFSDWCSSLSLSILADSPCKAYGGLVVPQSGQSAGLPVRYSSRVDKETAKAVSELVSSIWRTPPKDDLIVSDHPSGKFVISIISSWFDRPLGLVWALAPSNYVAQASHQVRLISIAIALVIRGVKGARALSFLSQPIWKSEGLRRTTHKAAESIIRACMETLGCKTAGVWELDESAKPAMLRTSALVGEVGDVSALDMPMGHGVAGMCAQYNKCYVVDELQNKESLASVGLAVRHEYFVMNNNLRSAIFVPIDIGDRVAGVIAMYAERTRAFSEIDLCITKAFAERLAASYAHIDRIQQLEDKESRLKQEAASIESGVLAMEIVHDALNSLGIAQAQISIVKDKLSSDTKSKIYETTTSVSNNIDNAFKLFQKVRDSANIYNIRIGHHKLSKSIETVVCAVRPEAEQANIDLQWTCSPALKLKYDDFQISRVIKNMLINSVYFLQNVTHRQRKIKISVDQTSIEVLIRIWDNGIGIYPSDIDKVFDYFFTTKGNKGMGFGLAISERIIRENHKGKIMLNSVWGKETEFIIVLPRTL